MPISVSKLDSSSFDDIVTVTNVSSNVYTTTSVTTSPVVSVKPYISLKPFSDSGELSRKRERSDSSSDLSHEKIWAEFHSFWAFLLLSVSQLPRGHPFYSPVDRSRPSSSSSHLAPYHSPRRDCPVLLICLSRATSPAQPASPVLPTSSDRSGRPASSAHLTCLPSLARLA